MSAGREAGFTADGFDLALVRRLWPAGPDAVASLAGQMPGGRSSPEKYLSHVPKLKVWFGSG